MVIKWCQAMWRLFKNIIKCQHIATIWLYSKFTYFNSAKRSQYDVPMFYWSLHDKDSQFTKLELCNTLAWVSSTFTCVWMGINRKCQILSSFTSPQVVSNLYEFLQKKIFWRMWWTPLTSIFFFSCQWGPSTVILQNIFLCVLIFKWNIPLTAMPFQTAMVPYFLAVTFIRIKWQWALLKMLQGI